MGCDPVAFSRSGSGDVAYPILLWALGFGGYLMAPVADRETAA
ncbi:hypothetical protein ACFQJC_12140 [Haloferax namakaokahaiae]|uniref:Uncharacterized protein n=1 Tax=Haloferax namakaokahaiae TaxID=1748331 RepID=A0ABD5ZGW0_9EURY